MGVTCPFSSPCALVFPAPREPRQQRCGDKNRFSGGILIGEKCSCIGVLESPNLMVEFEGGALGSASSVNQSEILPWYPPAEAEVLLPASEMSKRLW